MARDQQRFDSRLTGLGALDYRRAIHFGHGVIDHQQINLLLFFKDLQGNTGIVCLPDRVAEVAQNPANKRAHVAIIFANEDTSWGHRQLGICRLTESAMGWAMPGDTRDYAAMTTPVTSAQVAKAWVRPDPRFAAVSWSRRRGKTLAT